MFILDQKTAAALTLAAISAFGLTACNRNDGDASEKVKSVPSDSRVSQPIEVNDHTRLYTVIDSKFQCNVVMNPAWGAASTGVSCKLTESGKMLGVGDQKIVIDGQTDLYVVNTQYGTNFIAVNPTRNSQTPSISSP